MEATFVAHDDSAPRIRSRRNLERNDFGRSLDESGRRTGRERQVVQIMVGDCNDGGIEVRCEIADRCNCDAREGTIEVPMLEAMGIACDDCGFIAVCVVGVIAVTVGTVILVVMFVMVMVRFVGAIGTMNVRMVSSAMPMMNYAHGAECLSLGIDSPTSVLLMASRYRISLRGFRNPVTK